MDNTDEGFTENIAQPPFQISIDSETKKNLGNNINNKNKNNENNKNINNENYENNQNKNNKDNENDEDIENYEIERNSPPKWYDTPLSSGATTKSIISNETVHTAYDIDSNHNTFPEIFQKNESPVDHYSPVTPVRPHRAPYVTPPWGQSSEEPLEVAAERVGISLPPHMTAEMLQMQSKVAVMQRQIDARDRTIRSLETDYALQVESFKVQVTTLRTDLIISQAGFKRETAAREALESGLINEENYLTSFLATAHKGVKELTSEYASCCAVLRNTELDLAIARKDMKAAQKAEKLEIAASLEAAGAATRSALRRAELEDETEGMIEALINSKILSADLSIEVDQERKKIHVLRRRLQKYAEKISTMELASLIPFGTLESQKMTLGVNREVKK